VGNIQGLVPERGVHIDNVLWPVGCGTLELSFMRKFMENPIVLAILIMVLTYLILEIVLAV